MFNRTIKRKSCFILFASILIGSAATVPLPALASGTCEDQALQRCELHFYEGRFGARYATIEECYEGEKEFCNRGACHPDCYIDVTAFDARSKALAKAAKNERVAKLSA